MQKRISTLPFTDTPEQHQKLLDAIERLKDRKGAVMPALQEAQEIYGYLPIEVQRIIAEKTGTPLEEIYGVASFYAQFKFNPNGEVAVAVCLGTACYVKGSGDIIQEFSDRLGLPVGSTSPDGKYSLEATRCIGACGLAPVLTVNGEVYGRLTKADVPGILAKYQK